MLGSRAQLNLEVEVNVHATDLRHQYKRLAVSMSDTTLVDSGDLFH